MDRRKDQYNKNSSNQYNRSSSDQYNSSSSDQYNRKNNLEIPGTPATITDKKLEKVIDFFSCLGICHRLVMQILIIQ